MYAEFFFIKFDLKDLRLVKLNENLLWKVFYESDDYLIIGHYIDLDNISKEIFIKKIIDGTHVELYSHFIVILFQKKDKTLKIISDLSCSFPLYYFTDERYLYCSTDYELLVSMHPNLKIDVYGTLRLIIGLDSSFFHEHLFVSPKKLLPYTELLVENNTVREKSLNVVIDRTPIVYKNIKDLACDYYVTLTDIINKYYYSYSLKYKTYCDLSTGFDSTIVSYLLTRNNQNIQLITFYDKKLHEQAENYDIVDKWLLKHNLNHFHCYVDRSNSYTAQTLQQIYESDYALFIIDNYAMKSQYSSIKDSVHFTGIGGDDVFSFINPEYTITQPYLHYYNLMKSIDIYKLDEIFLPKTLDFVYNYDYSDSPVIELSIPNNSVSYYEELFHFSYKNNVIDLHPFLDRRLAKYQNIKKIDNIPKNEIRLNVNKYIPGDVFIPLHFDRNLKQNYRKLYALYTERFQCEYAKRITDIHPVLSTIFDIDRIKRFDKITDYKIASKHSLVIHHILAVDNYLKKLNV